MESPSRARSVLGRRSVLRLIAATPVVAALSTACSSAPDEPDQLLALANAAKSDARLAEAVAQSHAKLADVANEIATARNTHAGALQQEIDRVSPRDPEDPPSVPDAPPQQAPGSASAASEALVEALNRARDQAAGLVPALPDYRAGLVGSISASCASLLEVLR
ncbi:hypothetical protein SAMN05421805_1011150 [Saccharopolyspora antimicrobica]|uniref:Tat (Twin-arginine translocation) pathway signal sequence n=1 Tax=Saccharopolyspora antimicrobica TaxID=455193 RepID=A0A1I4SUQ9_9PSEU|nr:hypothetical protein [Saccharopolyspora antimicrobica]RKT85996.1 hypothetical protein ATL45_4352 [Saccharopolyspora antimicrobica]SFM68161.1 hypothetical protein SAMN05421805_1011150 [Saccharopolyspora antimicrobica]